MLRITLAILLSALSFALPTHAEATFVQKRELQLAEHRFVDGRRLPVTLGFETYGRLNERRDNAVLICHFFGGSSHAAGRYAAGDPRPGYWDALIGPGKPLDTDRYFIVSADVLANINAHDPTVRSTGPYSLDPLTRQPYGGTFPSVTIRDQVAVQRSLMEDLGIQRWHTVMGASLGGMQALQWAVSHPDRVERVVTVAASGRADAYNKALCQLMIDAIRSDARWKNGDYYGQEAPDGGLASAWKLLFVHTLSRQGLSRGITPGDPASFLEALEAKARARIAEIDANAWISLSEASRDFDLGAGHPDYRSALGRIQAKVLAIAAEGDLLYPPELIRTDLVAPLADLGKPARFHVLTTEQGHLGAVYDMGQASEVLRDFLR